MSKPVNFRRSSSTSATYVFVDDTIFAEVTALWGGKGFMLQIGRIGTDESEVHMLLTMADVQRVVAEAIEAAQD